MKMGKICVCIFIVIFITIEITVGINVNHGRNFIRKNTTNRPFPLSIIHVNDFHARFDETDQQSSPCSPGRKCIGGYARLVYMVKHLLELRRDSNPLYLNAGDNFQGTLWYNIGRWNVTSYFLNLLRADAMTLGNHEFDHGIPGVVPFLEHIESPMVVANIDDSEEPTMQGKYKKSIVIEKGGRKIGIIGVIVQTTNEISNTGNLRFLDETETVKVEAERLHKDEGVDIIIVLSHCGLNVDRIMAKKAGPYIDVIVGGHSHTFLYTGPNPPGIDNPADNYPIEVIQETGHKVLIVQASAFLKYLGDLTVYFDENGEIVGHEGAPIYLDTDIPQDPEIVEELKPWKEIIDKEGTKEIGFSRVTLSRSRCKYDECNIGNFYTDALVHEYAKIIDENNDQWTSAAIAIANVGGLRTSLNKGLLTYAHLVATIPFENTINTFSIKGKYLLQALEYGVNNFWNTLPGSADLLQVSGLKITYNVTKPAGERIVQAMALCNKCDVPKYLPITLDEEYRIIAPSFLTAGGDGFNMLQEYGKDLKIGRKDMEVFIDYVQMQTPIMTGTYRRIEILE